MRVAYLDCFAGIAGDMFLGALIDAGVPRSILEDATASLGIGASLHVETVNRSGISSTKVHVMEDNHLAETPQATPHKHEDNHQHKHEHTHPHPHEHQHPHIHGRSLSAIRSLIQAAPLTDATRIMATHTFELLGQSEAKIHNVPVDDIHFHEVGAVDAIVDIVAACAGIAHLRLDQWYSSPVNVGSGMVYCAHGTFPVPAPATADLLRGAPTYSAHVEKELVTPTGAALLRALNPTFGPQPPMRVEHIGYGAGTRNPADFPNVLRLSVGQWATDVAVPDPPAAISRHAGSNHHHHETATVTVIETALDDMSPQLLAYVAETALATGALDVMLTPTIMKKGRPGTLLTVLCNPSDAAALEALIVRETTTLGVRIREDRRACLERSHTTVQTPFGPIRIKIGSSAGEERNAAPEFEDCRAAAARHTIPLKQVQQAAIAAYLR
jgi:uncharacterized protein (TIGR00299 family) protein